MPILARLAVAHDHVAHPVLRQHGGRDLARIGPVPVPMHVLGAQADAAAVHGAAEAGEGRKRRDQDDGAVRGGFRYLGEEIFKETQGGCTGHVHFPVPRNKSLAHEKRSFRCQLTQRRDQPPRDWLKRRGSSYVSGCPFCWGEASREAIRIMAMSSA